MGIVLAVLVHTSVAAAHLKRWAASTVVGYQLDNVDGELLGLSNIRGMEATMSLDQQQEQLV
ncbi:MAG: hypothetical protein M3R24_04380, partial [Chloroflexota bacterium]|nr:hypothetical protein [Chloroflexota bacterium]